MKSMLVLVITCYSLVLGTAQEKKEESGAGTIHEAAISQNGQIRKRQAFVSESFSWYQSGNVRVFFSADFAQALGPVGKPDYNDEFQATLGKLFRSGVLNGEMFSKEIGDLPPVVSHVSESDAALAQQTDVFHAMEVYEGPLVKILHYDMISRSETRFETITYELWVTSSRSESGWGEFHRFRVTIKKRLLLQPRLVKFEYLGIQI